MEVTTENSKKRGASESSKTKKDRDWIAVVTDTGVAALAIAGSAFLSGLAASAGASAYRKMTFSSDNIGASEAANVLQMQRKSV